MTNGGSFSSGNVFSIGTNGSGYQNLLSFSGTTGSGSYGSLTQSGSVLVWDDPKRRFG